MFNDLTNLNNLWDAYGQLKFIEDQHIRTNAVHKACATGNIELVSQLIKKNTDPEKPEKLAIYINQFALLSDNPQFYKGPPFVPKQAAVTPLMVACAVNNVPLVQLLINAGADAKKRSLSLNPSFDPNSPNEIDGSDSALGYCVLAGDVFAPKIEGVTHFNPSDPSQRASQLQIAELLLQKGADPTQHVSQMGYSPYQIAAARGDNDLIELFLKHGYSPLDCKIGSNFGGGRSELPLVAACGSRVKNPVIRTLINYVITKAGGARGLEFLRKREIGPFPHHIVSHNLSLLVSTGKSLFDKGDPLYTAVRNMVPENIEPLLEAGAKVVENESHRFIYRRSLTPLDIALDLEKYAPIDQTGAPLTGFVAFTPELKEEILNLFKKHPAFMFQRDKNGDTPIENAWKNRKLKTVEFLIRNGSPLFSVREEILAYLAEKNNQAWINFIQRRGKEVPPLELDHIGPFDYLPRADDALKRKAESSSSDAAGHTDKKQKLPEGENE